MQRVANSPLILKEKLKIWELVKSSFKKAMIKWVNAISLNLPAEELSKYK